MPNDDWSFMPPTPPFVIPPPEVKAQEVTYTFANAEGTAVIRNDGAVIPNDPDNADWIAYQEWVALGGVTMPYIPPPPLKPPPISRRQFYQELANMGSITQNSALGTMKTGALPNEIDNYIKSNNVPDDREFEANMFFVGAQSIPIDHEFVIGLAAYLNTENTTPEAMEAMWLRAAKL
jgi:hypothetical protein